MFEKTNDKMNSVRDAEKKLNPYGEEIILARRKYFEALAKGDTKLAEKWGKYTTTMMQFLSDINSNEKLMIKSFRDLNI
jgi:hypothetical protein